MIRLSASKTLAKVRRQTSDAAAPSWTVSLLGPSASSRKARSGDISLSIATNDAFSFISARAAGAAALGAADFEQLTWRMYEAIRRELKTTAAPNPVRFWNHLPEIHASSDMPDIDRYMNFNAGRFRALGEWLGGKEAFDRAAPTASAVGHRGTGLVVHVLGARSRGVAVANPRQVAPHRYSRRFGPVPPCFARATIVLEPSGDPAFLLVGGTASIRGEASVHVDDLRHQTDETFENLAHLIAAARGAASDEHSTPYAEQRRELLSTFTDLRVYYVREADRAFVAGSVGETFPASCRIEYVRADLCRRELLVEIEGRARISAAAGA